MSPLRATIIGWWAVPLIPGLITTIWITRVMVAKVMAVYPESPPNIGSISQGWSRKIIKWQREST